MNSAIQAESGDYDQLMELNNKMEKVMDDPAVAEKSIPSFASVFVMLVLTLTSVVALVKTLRGELSLQMPH